MARPLSARQANVSYLSIEYLFYYPLKNISNTHAIPLIYLDRYRQAGKWETLARAIQDR